MAQISAKRLPSALRLFLLINAAASALCAVAELICWRLGLSETYTNPFYVGFRFFDFDSFQERFHALHTLAFYRLDQPWSFSYPAPAALIYASFFPLGVEASLNTFLAVSLLCLLIAAGLFTRALIRRGLAPRSAVMFTATATLLAYPFWFCFQRANIEIIVWALLALAFWAFVKEKPYAAAVCIGLAASIKLAPVVYLLLFLPRRLYRQAATGLAVAAFSMGLGLWFLGPTVPAAWHGLAAAAAARQHEFLTLFNPDAIGFDHTPLGIVLRIRQGITAGMVRAYLICGATLGAVLYLTRIRKLPFANQLLALVTLAVWLPPSSFEYTLMHLYCAIAVLALASLEIAIPKPTIVLLALLVSPWSEFIHHGIRFGGQIQAILLGGLLVVAVCLPIPTRYERA